MLPTVVKVKRRVSVSSYTVHKLRHNLITTQKVVRQFNGVAYHFAKWYASGQMVYRLRRHRHTPLTSQRASECRVTKHCSRTIGTLDFNERPVTHGTAKEAWEWAVRVNSPAISLVYKM